MSKELGRGFTRTTDLYKMGKLDICGESFIYLYVLNFLKTTTTHVQKSKLKNFRIEHFKNLTMAVLGDVKTAADFNVFSGAENGILKCVSINPKANLLKNFNHNSSPLDREQEITW